MSKRISNEVERSRSTGERQIELDIMSKGIQDKRDYHPKTAKDDPKGLFLDYSSSSSSSDDGGIQGWVPSLCRRDSAWSNNRSCFSGTPRMANVERAHRRDFSFDPGDDREDAGSLVFEQGTSRVYARALSLDHLSNEEDQDTPRASVNLG